MKQKLTRSEKTERNRAALIDAAAVVVGKVGYLNASVAKITQEAGLGQGTFYRYFDNQQELFDLLLPLKGREALDHIGKAVKGADSFIEVELRALRAFISWARERPWFFRLLHEAHIAAPEGYRLHMDHIRTRFRSSLRRSWQNGEFPSFGEHELDTITVTLTAARDYLYNEFAAQSDQSDAALDDVLNTYRKLITFGLSGAPGLNGARGLHGAPGATRP
ncbi:TetR/AcrR family transcriptional regulator (plasmid) [Tistrella bauzanensis]|uniref:TetR/AcrR family transcriptional regulator n=1 Tax=Tistrella bauzanensis TaxID=657419 RepID=UPI001662A26C|nr:TetR/AcrR family transcriptional regulator [Tistrella bauzanensis]